MLAVILNQEIKDSHEHSELSLILKGGAWGLA
jgi:hypothetical protein